ncbi:sulfatase/phosphatase domain-containing protein [Reichenbachiella ulvae]|uniref:DUF4976 domain-containing protein n=1 Tax=Reichenbachiella ulvae TaxID=2980104 RepID=A0ABT3CZY2_9BACT|nr:sulfatase/phosphatase domain-containing protein [Reichenbachiella ulvae]MCV9389262.1 DUF4976 domain-containing protein [Reichenbachiella ulvae]
MFGIKSIDSYTYRPRFQLYNLKKDPRETNNLVGLPQHRETLQLLQQKLRKFQVETSDPWAVKWQHE